MPTLWNRFSNNKRANNALKGALCRQLTMISFLLEEANRQKAPYINQSKVQQ